MLFAVIIFPYTIYKSMQRNQQNKKTEINEPLIPQEAK